MFDFNGKTPKEIIFNGKSLSKLLFNGIEVWRKSLLPDGYLRCEYLESTGTQYIDLGYYPNQNTKVETNVNILSHNVSVINYLFGVYDSTRSFAVYYSNNTSYGWGVLCGSVDSNANVAYHKNIKQKVEFDRNNLFINGTSIYTVASTTTFTSTKPMYLFWGNGTSNRQSISRVYDFKIYENDTLVMDLIPCLDNNGTPCMYDMVSKQTFYNQGTGEFKWSINPTYLSLNMFVDGFVNASTGVVAPNSIYPRAISSPLVLFEKGKTYKLTSNLSATKTDDGVRFRLYGTDDGVRFRLYGTDDTYKMSLGASQISTNAYATFEALDDVGKANFYVAKDVLITPKQDFKARIMYIDSNYISEFKIEEI